MRTFTRAQVEEFIQKMHSPRSGAGWEIEVKNVELIYFPQNTTGWHVTFAYRRDYPHMSTDVSEIVYEEEIGEKLQLMPAIEREIPAGFATPEEEDAEMKRLAQEEHEQFQERQKQREQELNNKP